MDGILNGKWLMVLVFGSATLAIFAGLDWVALAIGGFCSAAGARHRAESVAAFADEWRSAPMPIRAIVKKRFRAKCEPLETGAR